MTRNNFDDILDRCLYMLQNEQTPLDDCLAQFPQYAADLRPLLEMVVEVGRFPRPVVATAAFNSGKQRMLATLAEKKHAQAVSPSLPNRYAQQEQHPFRLKEIFTMKRLFAFSLAAATALIIIIGLTIGSNFVFQTWRVGEVAQTASMADIVGVVQVQMAGDTAWQPVVSKGVVKPGDSVRTGDFSSVTLVLFDGSRTILGANTHVTVAQLSAHRDGSNKVIALNQWLGQTYNRVERLLDPASRFEIETPTAVTAVRGTEFTVQVDDDGTTQVTVVEGVVSVTAQEAIVEVRAGQSTSVYPDEPPATVVPATDSPLTTPQSQDDDDNDSDNGGVPDDDDAFPDDPDEDTDTDGDGIGDNADDDDDNDGVPDDDDAFPNDSDEDTDTDGDGVGDNADDDDDNDNDGIPDDQEGTGDDDSGGDDAGGSDGDDAGGGDDDGGDDDGGDDDGGDDDGGDDRW